MTPDVFLAQIVHRFPLLFLRKHDGRNVIGGVMEIGRGDDIVTRYKIEIHVSPDFPLAVPKVFEVGNTVPKTMDRHFCPADGSACLFVPEENYKYCNAKTTPMNFVRGPVYSFFVSQAHFDLTGIWPLGVRPHGLDGIMNYYQEEFGLKHPQMVIPVLKLLATRQIKDGNLCPCGRGRKIRNCHKAVIDGLYSTLPPEYFSKLAAAIQSHLNGVAVQTGSFHK